MARDNPTESDPSRDAVAEGRLLPSTTAVRRMMFRGSERYVMRDRRIAEVRAYYHYDESKDCELNGFPYNKRPYLEK